jgi:ribulose kinase
MRRYGGVVGLEWTFPKALEMFDDDRELFDATALWVEVGAIHSTACRAALSEKLRVCGDSDSERCRTIATCTVG